MSNYIMQVDFFGNNVRAETENSMVSLDDLLLAGNAWRLSKGKPAYQKATFLNSQMLSDYIEAAAEVWNKPKESFISKTGTNNRTRTMVHLSVALLLAEQISPWFHASVHKVFIEGKLLEYRELGGTEFKNLNAAIDLYLPDLNGKDSRTAYVICANIIRHKLLGEDAAPGSWDKASVAQTHSRYEIEKAVTKMLSMGVVKDLNHLRQILKTY